MSTPQRAKDASKTGLQTPPSTGHRADKENLAIATTHHTPGRVGWEATPRIHSLTLKSIANLGASAERKPIGRSILKKASLEGMSGLAIREETPEPEDPSGDAGYLQPCVQTIADADESTPIDQLIPAYSILAARLRNTVVSGPSREKIDANSQLLTPIRENASRLLAAAERDIARALIDSAPDCPTMEVPNSGGAKKKIGMSETEIRRARDLSTVAQACLRIVALFLGNSLLLPLFDSQLQSEFLSAVISIPLTPNLPTPHARKTNTIAMGVMLTQRLSDEVLAPFATRITHALRRAIDGELGREGKKGVAADAFKTIHTLSTHHAHIFGPPFTLNLLPPVFSALLSSTMDMRSLAAHALSGIAYAVAYGDFTPDLRVAIQAQLDEHLAQVTGKNGQSKESALIRRLQTNVAATDPNHVACGPVWVIVVLAALVTLAGPLLFSQATTLPSPGSKDGPPDTQLMRLVVSILSTTLKHDKSTVRALGTLLWRTVQWAFLSSPSLTEAGAGERAWTVAKQVLDGGARCTLVAGLLRFSKDQEPDTQEVVVQRIVEVLQRSVKKGSSACEEGLDMLAHMLADPSETQEEDWDLIAMLPLGLYDGSLLFNVESSQLHLPVKTMMNNCLGVDDVRALSVEEVWSVWTKLIGVWKDAVGRLEVPEEGGVPDTLLEIWKALLKIGANETDSTHDLAEQVSNILCELINNTDEDWKAEASPRKDYERQVRGPLTACLEIVHDLWVAVPRTIAPHAAKSVFDALIDEMLPRILEDASDDQDALRAWAGFCTDVILSAARGHSTSWKKWLDSVWSYYARDWEPEPRAVIWRTMARRWSEKRGRQFGARVLLVEVTSVLDGQLKSIDNDTWKNLLDIVLATSQGAAKVALADEVIGEIEEADLSPLSLTYLADAALMAIQSEVEKTVEIPKNLLNLLDVILRSPLPDTESERIISTWFVRSLTRFVEDIPEKMRVECLEKIQHGLATWIMDPEQIFTLTEYNSDILPLLQMILVCLKEQSISQEERDLLAPLLECETMGRAISSSTSQDLDLLASVASASKPIEAEEDEYDADVSFEEIEAVEPPREDRIPAPVEAKAEAEDVFGAVKPCSFVQRPESAAKQTIPTEPLSASNLTPPNSKTTLPTSKAPLLSELSAAAALAVVVSEKLSTPPSAEVAGLAPAIVVSEPNPSASSSLLLPTLAPAIVVSESKPPAPLSPEVLALAPAIIVPEPKVPVTPTTERIRSESTEVKRSILPLIFGSPSSPLKAKNGPSKLSPNASSSPKRRTSGVDKENSDSSSPSRTPVGKHSLGLLLPSRSILGKRSLSFTDRLLGKRPRIEEGSDKSSSDTSVKDLCNTASVFPQSVAVFQAVTRGSGAGGDAPDKRLFLRSKSVPDPNPLKRKRLVVDYVEIPLLPEAQRRRIREVPRLPDSDVTDQSSVVERRLLRSLPANGPAAAAQISSPALRRLADAYIEPASDDSVMIVSPQKPIGQASTTPSLEAVIAEAGLNPSSITSPGVRSPANDDSALDNFANDPPSDDSFPGSSPIRNVIERRQQSQALAATASPAGPPGTIRDFGFHCLMARNIMRRFGYSNLELAHKFALSLTYSIEERVKTTSRQSRE